MAPHRYRWLTGEKAMAYGIFVDLIGLEGEVL
jgi:hypothetical protein